ncbi:type VI secretion system baseplate subunit TssF [Pusillimonas noertemannii]|uniref:type VI secretion system baseplate subunit TssF n=1 Tax=Pusillimonas noertemannii TaxID=305977 RepID=UPI00333F0B56
MNPALLDYYNKELAYLREMGAEFAAGYPKVAARLGMNGTEVADPYVERLLEGTAFLTARIQMKMDAEFPRLTQRLLEVIHPNYLAPTPSMAVVQFEPSMNEGSLAKGFTLPRGTQLRSGLAPGEQTRCEFSTGHDVTLWPLRMVHAAVIDTPADLPLTGLSTSRGGNPVRSALRMRIEVCGGALLGELDVDRLEFFVNGQDVHASRLMELVGAHSRAAVCHGTERPVRMAGRLDADAVRHEGFGTDQALLPVDTRVFQGYRLLQEYAAFPERFLFFSVAGLRPHLRRLAQQGPVKDFELTLLFDDAASALREVITAQHLALHCVPVVNLMARRADRIVVSPRQHEHHVVVERTRPLDFEVYAVTALTGHAPAGPMQTFRPFYQSVSQDDGDYGAYYSLRREPRVVPDGPKQAAARSVYTGSECFVSLVDRNDAPYSEKLRHLGIEVLCTNRDLPLLLPRGVDGDFSLRVSAPVAALRLLKGPSRPRPALAEGAAAWRLISQLGLNYANLLDAGQEQGADMLRELLGNYAPLAEPALRRQIEGLRRVSMSPAFRRLPMPGPIQMGRAVRIDLQVDESAFSGSSPFVFGAVLERFLSRHVSINTMTETVLSSMQRGEVARWAPRLGARAVV